MQQFAKSCHETKGKDEKYFQDGSPDTLHCLTGGVIGRAAFPATKLPPSVKMAAEPTSASADTYDPTQTQKANLQQIFW